MKDYAGEPFQFHIAKKPYVLQELGFSDVEKVVGLGDLLKADAEKGIHAIRELVASKSNAKTAEAVMSIPPRKILELIKDWSGLTPGESETSGDE